jgi:multicomponent Na+:H+ antiporter subunit F
MSPADFLQACTLVALGLLVTALLVIVARLVLGPTVADRILGLDMLVTVGIGLIAVIAVRTAQFAYVDVAIALGLVGFLATAAFARFLLHSHGPGGPARGAADGEAPPAPARPARRASTGGGSHA